MVPKKDGAATGRNAREHGASVASRHADVGQALIRALRCSGIDGMTFNVADDSPVTAVELHDLNGQPVPEDAATRPLDDPWTGIIDTAAARTTLGFRPIFPTVYTAKAAGAL